MPPDVRKVYLLNQDYLWGHSVSRDVKQSLAKLRRDVQIVGDEYIRLGMVKDFSPYIAKIKASAAQSVVTGNYGPDLNLLIRAGADAGLHARFDTYLAWFPAPLPQSGRAVWIT